MNCDVCGKNMLEPDGTPVIGIAAGPYDADDTFAQEQMGIYGVKHKYAVCLECVLKALGVSPRAAG